jgi:hypothetical protein
LSITNLSFAEWAKVSGDAKMTTAVLNRATAFDCRCGAISQPIADRIRALMPVIQRGCQLEDISKERGQKRKYSQIAPG